MLLIANLTNSSNTRPHLLCNTTYHIIDEMTITTHSRVDLNRYLLQEGIHILS